MAPRKLAIRPKEAIPAPAPVTLPSLDPVSETPPPVKLLRSEDYEGAIQRLWQESHDRFLLIGELLLEWKGDAEHGEFMKRVADRLPFNHQTANKLMKIAEAKGRIAVDVLPPRWTVVYAVAALPAPLYQEAEREGLIRSNLTEREVAEFKGRHNSTPAPKVRARRSLERKRNQVMAQLAEIDDQLAGAAPSERSSRRSLTPPVTTEEALTRFHALLECEDHTVKERVLRSLLVLEDFRDRTQH